jgi:D-hydroxyproline dehydrogenase subunit gamma
MQSRFVRLGERDRRRITIFIDGAPVTALEGDLLLTVLMLEHGFARISEFGDGKRAGFCMMGACQDCWVWTAQGQRMRACSASVVADMAILTAPPRELWPIPAPIAPVHPASSS